jgi:excinuclease ABC subunit B
MYADTVTGSMKMAIGETDRRRAKQVAYNEAHGITPKTIIKAIDASLVEMYSPEWAVVPEVDAPSKAKGDDDLVPPHELPDRISGLRRDMMEAADKLDYERAAELRDRIKRLERRIFGMEAPPPPPAAPPGSARSNIVEGKAKSDRSTGNIGPRRPTRGITRSSAQTAPKQGRLKLTPDR